MFKVQSNGNAYVPSKSVALKPDVVSDVVGEDQIRINVPSYIGYIDPNASYLKFSLTIENARGCLVPDKDCGGHALIRNLEIRDGGNKSQIEYCEDYNANYALLSNYTKQNSISHKRDLFIGQVSKLGDRIYDPSLYYASPPALGGTITAPTGVAKTPTNPTLQLPLNCGLWKQGQVIPVGAMNGLRLTIDTEHQLRALMYLGDERRLFSDKTAIVASRTLVFDDGAGNNIKQPLATANVPALNDIRGVGIALTIFGIELNMTARETCPFDVNDILYISDVAGGNANEEKLGTIVGFSQSAGNRCVVSYVPDRDTGVGIQINHPSATSQVYIKLADRTVAHQVVDVSDINVNTKSRTILAPTYRMSNIELIVQQISPPAQYVASTMKAVQGEKGIQMDIMAYELHRHNQNNIQGLQQIVIPTRMRRAKSLFSQPLAVNRFRNLIGSSFQGIADAARSYEWIYGTKHYPTRLAPLARYSQQSPNGNRDRFKTEALHSSELQKAILNVNERVLSLQRIPEHFAIARGLTKYGQIMDLSNQTLSLRVDYLGTAAVNKLFNNYVYGLRRIIINKDGVQGFN